MRERYVYFAMMWTRGMGDAYIVEDWGFYGSPRAALINVREYAKEMGCKESKEVDGNRIWTKDDRVVTIVRRRLH